MTLRHNPALLLALAAATAAFPAVLHAAPPAAPADFFVATGGSDAAPGTREKPFATLGRARDAVRRLKASQPGRAKPITVLVRGGVYPLAEPLTLTPEDSGTDKAPVVWAAYPGEEPVLSGGRRITGWREVAKGRWQVSLPDPAWTFSQLWVGDQRRFRPSLPKNGYHFLDSAVGGTSAGAQDRFRYAEGQVRADWKNLHDVEVVAFHSWGTSRLPIKEVDTAERVVTLGGGTWHAQLAELKPATWYRLENVGEAMSEPGEWYLDRRAGTLTYLSRPGEDPNKVSVIAPRLSRVVDLKGDVGAGTFVDHVTLRGLTFAHTNWNTPPTGHSTYQAEVDLDGAVTGRNARHIALQNCVVRHTAAHGVDFGAGCKDVRVVGCELVDLGAGGVKIGSGKFNEEKDEKQWADGGVVRDCLIAHGGRVHPGSAGVWIGHAANNVVEHNRIHDLYYCGLSVGWRWSTGFSPSHHNTVAYNHLYDLGQDVLSDLAGIYTLGEQPGTTLRFNKIHDISRSRYGGWGIYFDESSGHILAEKNVVYRTEDAPFHLHHGRENAIRNNVFAYGTNAQIQLTNLAKSGPMLFESNLFYWKDGKLLQGEPDEEIAFRRNLYWRAGGDAATIRFAKNTALDDWRKIEAGVLVADPLFVNPDKGDFRLRPGSPAARVGFEPFDVAPAGRLTRKDRTAALPPVPRAFPPAPPERPVTVREDFDAYTVGQGLPGWQQQAAGTHVNASVTDEAAASGKNSLRFTDGPEGAAFYPHLFTDVKYGSGVVRSALALRVERGALPQFEWRDTSPWYKSGPSIEVTADGTLKASGKDLVKVPFGQWVRIEMVCGVGPQADGKYTVTVTLPGDKEPRRFEAAYAPGFKTLGWVGFVSAAYEKSVYYVDDLVVEPAPSR